jgi:pimeloyl-ACP methyl ester carboxylesterase
MKGTWLRRAGATTPSMVVVFVHGILSDSEKCWLHDNGTYWPKLLIEHDSLGEVGLYKFTYQTGIFSGSYSLGDVVNALNTSLILDNVIAASRIIFVAHSMGGIVVRRYVVQRLNELVERGTEIGLFLLASPSLGSSYANWLSPIAKFLGHAQGTALAFCESNTWLNDLNTDFRNALARGKLVIYGQELVEDRFVVLKRAWFLKRVVPPFSGASYFGEGYKVPGSDHFSISKPEGIEAIQHRLLCQFIQKITHTGFDLSKVSESNGELRTVVSGCEICVTVGRIENYPPKEGTVVALPCNEYFDDRCTDDARSALGAYVSRHCQGRASAFSALIQEECRRRFGQGINQQKTSDDVAESFGVGRCILLSEPLGHPVSVALIATTTQRAGQGLASRISYQFDGMRELFALLADKRLNEVAMPVLGAGHGGIDPPLALVGLLLALAEAARYGSERQRRKKVTIIVFSPTSTAPPEVPLGVIRRALALVANKD